MASTTSEQTDKNNDQVKLDLNQVGKTDTPSHNEDQSDTNTKTNEETKQVETTTTVTSTNSKSNANDEKNKQKDNTFPIEKGDQEHLTDFQRQKAKYFFNVNLDIENKEYVTWDDVEFYLLFHITAAGKEGSDGGDLENRLSRAARAFWEHVHDQVPLDDGKRDKLTLVQFLDTWESLIDYVVRTNQLPGVVQELVNLGFELYSTTSEDEKIPTIQPQAFDQLFQKMNIGRPYALLAYKYLTDNGTKPLDADRIESLVKAVITSSDDENDSHFLLPGFFKTLSSTDKNNKSSSSSPVQEEEQSTKEEKTTSTTKSDKPSSPPPPQPNKSTPQPQEQQKGSSPTSPTQEKKQSSSINQNGVNKPSTTNNQQRNVPQQAPPPPPPQIKQPQKPSIQQEDDSIRNILRFYHIDDGDLVEVAGGSVPRLVLVHPERPLPPYIQQNKELLQKIQPDVSVQQNGFNNNYNTNGTSSQETKPKVTLEERVSRGEAQKGPTTPVNQSQKQDNSTFANVRQVYPPLSEIQQEEQRKQAKLQATQSNNQQQKQRKEESSTDNDATLSSKPTKDINHDDEEKIIAAVLKQLAPIVEQRVAAEVRRLQSADTDEDEDDNMIPFPFMFGGGFPIFAGPPPSSQAAREQRSKQNTSGQEQQSANEPRLQAGPTFIPPQLLMAMMNDLARGGMAGGDIPVFSPNMPPPPHGPAGVEGFMMFVDDDQFMGGPPPSRPPPTF